MILVTGKIAGLSWKLTQRNLVVRVVPSFLPVLIMMGMQWNVQMLKETTLSMRLLCVKRYILEHSDVGLSVVKNLRLRRNFRLPGMAYVTVQFVPKRASTSHRRDSNVTFASITCTACAACSGYKIQCEVFPRDGKTCQLNICSTLMMSQLYARVGNNLPRVLNS